MKLKFIKASVACLIFFTVNIANAGVISYHTASGINTNSCVGITSDYINNNQTEIENVYGNSSYKSACTYYSNSKGLSGESNSKNITGRRSYSEDSSQNFIESILDSTSLSLPEIHMLANSNSEEYVMGRSFAAQQYYWSGEDTTLTFTANFDYSISADGYYNDFSSGAFYEAAIAAITNLDVSVLDEEVYPIDMDENLLLGGAYYSSNQSSNLGVQRYEEGVISFDFNVTTGMNFYLFGRGKVEAWNDGWVDSSHTLVSALTVSGRDSQESEAIISTHITRINTISVPEPTSLTIFGLSFIGLVVKRFKGKKNN